MSKLTYKIATASIAVMTIASLSAPAFAQVSVSDLLAQIQALQAQLMQLQGGSTTVVSSGYTFAKNLTIGSKGEDVKQLQSILIAGGYLKIAAPTSYFGAATKAAVVAWQKAVGITPTSGYVGALSRAKLNAGSTTGSTGGTVVTATDSYLKVENVPSLGGNIPSSSLYNKVLNLKLTAGKDAVVMTGITATRGGYISNTRINGVSVWDEAGNRYGNIVTSLTSDGKVTVNFGSSPLTIPAGTTKTLSVAVNLDSTSSSASLNLSVVSASDIKVSGTAPVQGIFPIVGATYTVVDGSASLGDVWVDDQTVSGLSSSTAQSSSATGNLEIGDTQREVFKLKLSQNNSKEAIALKNVTVYVSGNIVESTDLKNWKLYSQEGNVLATADAAKDRFVTFNLATPYTIDKGLSRTFSVKTDVMDGSGRYFNVNIQNDYDLVVTGVTTGASVLLKDGSGNSFEQADTVDNTAGWFKMKQGGLTVTKAAVSPSGTLAPSASNIVLGQFEIKSSGEQLEMRKMKVFVTHTTDAPVLTGSIMVKDADTGETYISISADTTGVQGTSTSAAVQQSLSTYLPLSSNQTRKIQVVGSVSSNATSGSYQAYIGAFYGKRFSTNDFVDLTTNIIPANSLSLKNVTLSVTKNTSFANVNRAAGVSAVKIGDFNLQASSADDVQINTISMNASSSSNLSNLMIKYGDTQLGSTIGTPSDTGNSFTITGFKVGKSETKSISVYADIQSGSSGTSSVTITNVGGYGVASGKALDTLSSNVVGQTVAIANPSVTIAKASNSSIASRILLSGSTGVSLGDIKFSAANETLSLRKVTLKIVGATTSYTAAELAGNFSALKLANASGDIASAPVTVVESDAVASISIPEAKWVSLTQDADTVLTVKADVSDENAIKYESVFKVSLVSTSSSDLEINSQSQGLMTSGITATSADTEYYKVQASAATVVAATYTPGTGSGAEVARFTVAKQGVRNPQLSSITLKAQNAGGSASSTVTDFELWEVANGQPTTLVATSSAELSGAASSSNVIFSLTGYTGGSAKDISSNVTYAVKADVSGIETGVTNNGQNTASLYIDFVGSTGYSSSDTSDYWANGNVTYSYSVVGTGQTSSNLTNCDTATVRLGTNTY